MYFETAVNSIGITENKHLLTETGNLEDQIKISIKKFENLPSILSINENINVEQSFQFSKITSEEGLSEINILGSRKVGSHKNIATKIVKESSDISIEHLAKIWNEQVLRSKNFPNELNLADITPISKKDDSTLAKNYRPVRVFPCISKVFESIIQKRLFSTSNIFCLHFCEKIQQIF